MNTQHPQQPNTDNILAFNPSTGYYEGTIPARIQVDAEIFRRLMLKAVEDDETADLTNPQTWIDIISRIGKIESWIGKPHTKIIPLLPPPPLPTTREEAPVIGAGALPVAAQRHPPKRKTTAATSSSPSSTTTKTIGTKGKGEAKPKTFIQRLEEEVRTRVQEVPPHLWDTACRTPIPDKKSVSEREYGDMSRIRSDEKKILAKLHQEWQDGQLTLSEAAEEEARAYQQQQKADLMTTAEAVAHAVNGNRFQ